MIPTGDRPSLSAMGDSSGDVLIVDDFPDTLALYEAMLTDDGHRVRTAPERRRGAEEGRRAASPSSSCSTCRCPAWTASRCSGAFATRRGGGPAVIMLTAARREPHAIEAGLKEGADAYLTKPIDSRELLARVRAALETFRLKRMLEAQRRDHIAMLVHDLRHPLSSLGLIAELLDADDLDRQERQRGRRADTEHVHRDVPPGRRRARREPPRGRRLHRRAAGHPRPRRRRADAGGLHAPWPRDGRSTLEFDGLAGS